MTTPKAIFGGLTLVALAIASIPYSTDIMKPKLQKVVICDPKSPSRVLPLRVKASTDVYLACSLVPKKIAHQPCLSNKHHSPASGV